MWICTQFGVGRDNSLVANSRAVCLRASCQAQRGRLVISPVQQKYLFSYRIQSTKISTKIIIYAMNNMDTNVDMKKAKWMAFVYYGKPVNECF